jgi:hypothetical protein
MTFIEGEIINLFSHRWCLQDEGYLVTGPSIMFLYLCEKENSSPSSYALFCITRTDHDHSVHICMTSFHAETDGMLNVGVQGKTCCIEIGNIRPKLLTF